MIKVPDEIKEEFNNFRIAGGFKEDKGKIKVYHCSLCLENDDGKSGKLGSFATIFSLWSTMMGS